MLFRFGASLPFARSPTRCCSPSTCVARARDRRLHGRGDAAARRPDRRRRPAATPPSARSSPPSRTPASWACRCWSRCSATRRRPGDRRDRSSTSSSRARSASPSRSRSATLGGAADARDADRALRSLRGALTNPLPWAIASAPCSPRPAASCPAPLGADRPHARRLGHAGRAVHDRRRALARRRSMRTRETPVAHYLPVALIKLLVHPALVLAIGLAARALGAPLSPFAPDGADPDRGAAEREQRLAARRALRRRQRPHRANHHGLDGARVRDLLGHGVAVRRRANAARQATAATVFCIQSPTRP